MKATGPRGRDYFYQKNLAPKTSFASWFLPHPHSFSCLALHVHLQLEVRSSLRKVLGWQGGRTHFIKSKYLKLRFQPAIPTTASSSFYFLSWNEIKNTKTSSEIKMKHFLSSDENTQANASFTSCRSQKEHPKRNSKHVPGWKWLLWKMALVGGSMNVNYSQLTLRPQRLYSERHLSKGPTRPLNSVTPYCIWVPRIRDFCSSCFPSLLMQGHNGSVSYELSGNRDGSMWLLESGAQFPFWPIAPIFQTTYQG